MTKPVAEAQYLQKTYSCQVRLLGAITNTVPLEGVTRDELKLLAYIHGAEALANVEYLGMRPVLTFNPDEGSPVYVESQMDEYRRLARKYDTIVNSGRGKAAVEKCFGVQLLDFDAILDKESPIDVAERQAAEAEARTLVSLAGEQRERDRREGGGAVTTSTATPPPIPAAGNIGSRLASTITTNRED